jgi:hypothetical protein
VDLRFFTIWVLPIAAVALILSGSVMHVVLGRKYGSKSPLERTMTKRERVYYHVAAGVWATGYGMFALGIALIISSGRPMPLTLVTIGAIAWLLVRRGVSARLMLAKMHGAFDNDGVCHPGFLAYALGNYAPEDDISISIVPLFGDTKMSLTVGDHRVILVLPSHKDKKGQTHFMDPSFFLAQVLPAIPPKLLSLRVVWERGQRDTVLHLPSQPTG